jgi:cobalt-zinc-cadmium efflux system outer membrane protein
MPNKALVAFGIALGIGVLSSVTPVWCSGLNTSGMTDTPHHDVIPQRIQQNASEEAPSGQTLTLEEAVNRALRHNPGFNVYTREIEARNYEAQQAGLLPNPELSVETENIAGSGSYSGTDSAETTVLLSQRVELGGKRHKRLDLGLLDKQLAEQEHVAARVELVATTTERFIAVLAAQERLALSIEQADLADKVLQTVSERIAAGKTAQIEWLRFQTLLVEAKLRTQKAHNELRTTRNALASLWSRPEADFAEVQGDLKTLPVLPDQAQLPARLQQSPQLAVRQVAVRKAEQGMVLERAKRIPDLEFSVGGKKFEETNDHALVAGLSINLPLFDRNQGGIGAARARQAQALAKARATELRLQTSLDQICQRLQSAYLEARTLRDQLLPSIQQNFEAITYGYQVGKFGYLEVLDAEQALFEVKDRYLESLVACHQALVDLERLLGRNRIVHKKGTAAAVTQQRGHS